MSPRVPPPAQPTPPAQHPAESPISVEPQGSHQGDPSSANEEARLVVIGNFDGVHLGHRAVLEAAATRAQLEGLRLCVLTFDPHPAAVLSGKIRPALTTVARKSKILRDLFPGLEVFVQHFDSELAALSPLEFVEQILVERLHARMVLVGENFRFGKSRAGDLSTLTELGLKFGFEARSESLRGDAEGTYSSTRVRESLKAGDVRGAARLLGRPHWVSGEVQKGDQRGRTLGFPTANLNGILQTCPAEGVYAVYAYLVEEGAEQALGPAVAHLGARPSVDRPPTFEVHVLDQHLDLYGKTLGVAFVQRIRGVEKFASVEALGQQITRDIQVARIALSAPESSPS